MWGRDGRVCVLVHVYGSAHMCNRCVISAPRPHHCCQHVRSSACVTEDCFTEVMQLEPPLHPTRRSFSFQPSRPRTQKLQRDGRECVYLWVCLWMRESSCLILCCVCLRASMSVTLCKSVCGVSLCPTGGQLHTFPELGLGKPDQQIYFIPQSMWNRLITCHHFKK